jgi:hypothetical protein
MITHKQSVGLSYVDFNSDTYKKLDIEVALPEGLGYYHGMPSFFKVDGFLCKTHTLIEEKLKMVC